MIPNNITQCPICKIEPMNGYYYPSYCKGEAYPPHAFTSIDYQSFVIRLTFKNLIKIDTSTGNVYLYKKGDSVRINDLPLETITDLSDEKFLYYLDYLKAVELFE